MTEYQFILAPSYAMYRQYLHDHKLFERTHIFLDDENQLRGFREVNILCLPGWDTLKDNIRILDVARHWHRPVMIQELTISEETTA